MPFKRSLYVLLVSSLALLYSCNDKFSSSLFKPQTPHQKYEQKLKDGGLANTVLYKQWINAAERSLIEPLAIDIPYLEQGYFADNSPGAAGYVFEALNGEQLQITFALQSVDSTQLFVDLFQAAADTSDQHKHLQSADKGDTSLIYNISKDGKYVLRIQAELLSRVSYELRITAEASLGNPVANDANQNIGSFFGDGREAGRRKHEGIDIFAARSTPAVAAADGVISRVGTNNLGGKIIFLRPRDRSINLYYAHLDSQLVTTGQAIHIGDTIGLIGNTGNARTTPPHLHFGIYASGGAVDPLPFIRPGKSRPPRILSDLKLLGDTIRVASKQKDVAANTPATVEAATQNGYRIILPDGRKTFVLQKATTANLRPLRTLTLATPGHIYHQPNQLAAVVKKLPERTRLTIIGEYDQYHLIEHEGTIGWLAR